METEFRLLLRFLFPLYWKNEETVFTLDEERSLFQLGLTENRRFCSLRGDQCGFLVLFVAAWQPNAAAAAASFPID